MENAKCGIDEGPPTTFAFFILQFSIYIRTHGGRLINTEPEATVSAPPTCASGYGLNELWYPNKLRAVDQRPNKVLGPLAPRGRKLRRRQIALGELLLPLKADFVRLGLQVIRPAHPVAVRPAGDFSCRLSRFPLAEAISEQLDE